jgi:hypothetical protein
MSLLFIWDDEVFSKVYGLLSSIVLAFVVDSWSRAGVVWPYMGFICEVYIYLILSVLFFGYIVTI